MHEIHFTRRVILFLLICFFFILNGRMNAQTVLPVTKGDLKKACEKIASKLIPFYQDLHAHPELSFHEESTSEKIAQKLEALGYEVTRKVGGYGVVGVLKNGSGPTLMIRTDMDALPIKEETGLPYCSVITTKDNQGNEVGVMHACGHDIHMSVFVGVAELCKQFKQFWKGTLLLIAQPAEEKGAGAKAMLDNGLFERFPRPDFALALHVSPTLPAGSVGIVPEYAFANLDAVDITVFGIGGHGAIPNATIDPIVLTARYILAMQTIVSRELPPIVPAVISVGSIHGGTKHNIITEKVHLQLTVRSYSDDVRNHILKSLKRIGDGIALSAGLPEEKFPIVSFGKEYIPAVYNDPELTKTIESIATNLLGEAHVFHEKPTMAAEDFGQYGIVEPKIPVCLFWLGAVNRNEYNKAKQEGYRLPSLHSSKFAPDPQPSIAAGVQVMSASVLYLLKK